MIYSLLNDIPHHYILRWDKLKNLPELSGPFGFVFWCRSRREEACWRKSTWSKTQSSPFKPCWTRWPVLGRGLKSINTAHRCYLYFSWTPLKCLKSVKCSKSHFLMTLCCLSCTFSILNWDKLSSSALSTGRCHSCPVWLSWSLGLQRSSHTTSPSAT